VSPATAATHSGRPSSVLRAMLFAIICANNRSTNRLRI